LARTGRPRVEYSEKYHPLWARSLSRMGLTFDEVAREFGIGRTTLRTWVQTYPDLEESLREGKGAADARVEDSLFRRAVGYEYEESKIIAEKNPALGKVTPKRVEKTTRHIPPDVTAQIFWLKNRRPDLWRDVSRMEHAGRVEVTRNDPEIEKLIEDPKAQVLLAELYARLYAGAPEGNMEDPGET